MIFTLCKKCTETKKQNNCSHDNNEKSFIGISKANFKAISKGYKILNVYEVWHFDKTSDDLFKGYLRKFIKIKLESSKCDFKTKDEEDIFKSKMKES